MTRLRLDQLFLMRMVAAFFNGTRVDIGPSRDGNATVIGAGARLGTRDESWTVNLNEMPLPGIPDMMELQVDVIQAAVTLLELAFGGPVLRDAAPLDQRGERVGIVLAGRTWPVPAWATGPGALVACGDLVTALRTYGRRGSRTR